MNTRRNLRFVSGGMRASRHFFHPKRLFHFLMVGVIVLSILPTMLIISFFSTPSFAVTANQGPRVAVGTADCVNTTGVGTVAWSNAGQASAADTTYATVSVDGTTSNYIKCINYGFTIPSGATIDGMVVTLARFANGTGSSDAAMRIVKGNVIGTTDRSTATTYGTTLSSEAHGTSSDLWGQTWASSDINASNFGTAFAVRKASSAGAAQTVSVAEAQITVYYSFDPTFSQSAYRWFNNQDSASPVNVGAPLGGVAQNTGGVSGAEQEIIRLRIAAHVASSVAPGGTYFSFKLQYAARGSDNLCDTSFTNEVYSNVTSATPIAFGNNPTAPDGAALTANANDPQHSTDTTIRQQYDENNVAYVATTTSSGQDALWDFALMDNGAPADTTYCLRLVTTGNVLLNSYSVIPQLTTGSASLKQDSYRWFKGQDATVNNTFAETLNTSNGFVAGKTVQSLDGGYISVGGTNTSTVLTKFDASGQVIWATALGNAGTGDGLNDVRPLPNGSYIVTGKLSNDALLLLVDASGGIVWSKTWGGIGVETSTSVQLTSDGGYVVGGSTNSYGSGGYDAFIAKWSSAGDFQWSKVWGGASFENTVGVTQSTDGGYLLAGGTTSFLSSNSAFHVKFDTYGNLLWSKVLRGVSGVYSLASVNDGGYVIAGSKNGSEIGGGDAFLAKFDAAGTYEWGKAWGGTSLDVATSTLQTTDGGYMLSGYTYSFGPGGGDLFIAKFDSTGAGTWNKEWGTADENAGGSLTETDDGGYILAGSTIDDTTGILVKYDSTGTVLDCPPSNCTSSAATTATASFTASDISTAAVTPAPSITTVTPSTSSPTINETPLAGHLTFIKTLGGANAESAYATIQTSDGGYAVAGQTHSYGSTLGDAFIAKYSSTGTLSWTRTWGGTNPDVAFTIIQTDDGGYAIAGSTTSFSGSSDAFVVKYTSTGALSWDKVVDDYNDEYLNAIQQTSDGGFIIAGSGYRPLGSDDDMFVAKLDTTGAIVWWNYYGDYDVDQGTTIAETSDGGYVIAGHSYSVGAGGGDAYILKLDDYGYGEWGASWGGSSFDSAYSIIQTSDGGYAVTGTTYSYSAAADIFTLKYSLDGTLIWNKVWQGSGGGADFGNAIEQTSDGGYAVTGYESNTNANALLIKYNHLGSVIFAKSFGNSGSDIGSQVRQTSDGGYVIAGQTESFGAGSSDALLLKLDSEGGASGCSITICHLPSFSVLTPSATITNGSMADYPSFPAEGTYSPVTTSPTPGQNNVAATSIWGLPGPVISTALAAQNNAAVSARHDGPLRLRALVGNGGGKPTLAGAVSMKLQVSQKVGTCDPTFTGETYVDLGASAPFSYYDNTALTNGLFTLENPLDPTPTSGGRMYGTYVEASGFTNNHAILSGQNELIDLSIKPADDTVYGSYCFRIVKSDNSQLASYANIFELSVPPAASQQLRHGQFFDEQGGAGLTPYYW